jgi:hypothetical protein
LKQFLSRLARKEEHMADRGFDPTLKALVEAGPDDWPVLLG